LRNPGGAFVRRPPEKAKTTPGGFRRRPSMATARRLLINPVGPTDLLLHPFRKGGIGQAVHRDPVVTDVFLAQLEGSGRLMAGKFDDDQMFLLLNLVVN